MKYEDLPENWDARNDKLDEIAAELREYAQLEGTEFGDMASTLVEMYDCSLGEEFRKAVEKEMCNVLEHFKKFYKIVETTETYTKTYRELEEIY